MLLCLFLQAAFVTLCLRQYSRHMIPGRKRVTWSRDILLLSVVMLLTLIGNLVQMCIWALLFMLLGEFHDFNTAVYYSAVTFATLGYGDIVMTERWRLLGPLEAANGILMFGLSTAIMTATVMDVLKFSRARLKSDESH
jgi:hypothetical protein